MKKYNIIILFIAALLAISISINIKYRKDYMDQYGLFLNHSFHLVSDTTRNLEGIINDAKANKDIMLDSSIILITKNLFELERVVYDGGMFINRKLDIGELWGFDFIAEAILGTANSNTIYYNGHHFLEDGIVSDKELEFLITLHDDLMVLQEKLADEDGLNENENITIEEFKNAVEIFFEKWGCENANGYIEGDKSPFNILLE